MPTYSTSHTLTDQATRFRVVVAGVCALILTIGLARFAYTPLLPIMREQAGLSHVAGGWLATINYAGYMSGALLAASTGDMHRKFTLYRWGLVVAVLSTLGMGLTQNVWWWAVWRFAGGLSGTAGMLLASGLVLNWLVRHQFRPELGLHFMGVGLGIVVSGLGVGLMVDWLTWQQQWLGLGLLGLLFGVPAWCWLPAPATLAAGTTQGSAAPPAQPSQRWMGLMTAAYFCAGFGFAISATFTVAILAKLPLLAGQAHWVWVLVGLATAPACFGWDKVAHRIGHMAAIMWAFALQTVSLVLPLVSQNPALNVVGAVLFGATFIGIVSLTLTVVGRRFPANPAKAMARMTLSYGVAQIAAPAMTGYIADATGSYQGALLVTVMVMTAGVVLLGLLRREERLHTSPLQAAPVKVSHAP